MKTPLRVVNPNDQETDSMRLSKVSLEDFRKIWNDEHHQYSDEELTKIKDWLYTVSKVVIAVSQRMEKEYLLTQQQQTKEHETSQSYPIRQSEYRRAS